MSTRTPTHHQTAHILLPSSPSGTSHTSHTLPYPPNACACHTPCGHIQTTAILSIIYTSTSRQLFHVALGVERPCQNLSWRETTTLGAAVSETCSRLQATPSMHERTQNQTATLACTKSSVYARVHVCVYVHIRICTHTCLSAYGINPLMELITYYNMLILCVRICKPL